MQRLYTRIHTSNQQRRWSHSIPDSCPDGFFEKTGIISRNPIHEPTEATTNFRSSQTLHGIVVDLNCKICSATELTNMPHLLRRNLDLNYPTLQFYCRLFAMGVICKNNLHYTPISITKLNKSSVGCTKLTNLNNSLGNLLLVWFHFAFVRSPLITTHC